MFLWFSLQYFVFVLFAFVVLGYGFSFFSISLLRQKIEWEERLLNDPFCVEWNVKPQLNQSDKSHKVYLYRIYFALGL